MLKVIENVIKNNQRLKSLIHYLLIPKNQARPRLWVRLLLTPIIHKKGRRSTIRKNTRMDILPFNKFVLNDDSTIEDFSTVNNGVGDVIIGKRTRIGIGNVLIGPVTIGNDVMLAQNIVISGLNHNYSNIFIPTSFQKVTTNEIIIDDETWIGSNSVILPGVHIGKHCVIGAGSVVTKNIPDFSVAVGNPAKIIRRYNAVTKQWEKLYENILS